MSVAAVVARRSRCSRAKIGAVIVSSENRIIATGYNGPPANTPLHDGECVSWCERAKPDAEISSDYFNCISIHAEANALMFCDRSVRVLGSLYVTSNVCVDCAKMIANSGIARVVMCTEQGVEHRRPQYGVRIMRAAGLEVVIYE